MRRCYGCFESIKDNLEICPHCGYKEGSPPEESIHMEPGTILADRYTIGKVIGYGGFGVTYIGWDSKLEHKVAIKEYLPSEFSTRMPGQSRVSIFSGVKNEQFTSGLNKFVDEAKKLSKFQQEDGIVTIFDCIAENDTAYIIMEYLEGETLAERLKREKTIPEKEALEIMMPVMKSLEAVHNADIIHRDIAPDNIFLTKDGRVKLIDFGAARFATTAYSRSLTVIIKPGYSAEEQYRSKSGQGRHTDVYSIAATIYKMLTGETPPDALERRAKIEHSRKEILTEPRKINKKISRVTENAILNALNIRIEDRTQTVAQLIADLTADEPVKRVYGKIKKIDIYQLPVLLKVLVPLILVAFLSLGVLVAMGIIQPKDYFKTTVEVTAGYTMVPNVEGMDIESAANLIHSCNLEYSTGGNAASKYVDPNLIMFQSPDENRILPVNSVIVITVSKGGNEVKGAVNGVSTVPVFIWSEEKIGVIDFENAGLVPTVEYIYDKNVTAGQVVRVSDAEGNDLESGDKIPEGTEVILYVSTPYSVDYVLGSWDSIDDNYLNMSVTFKGDNTGYFAMSYTSGYSFGADDDIDLTNNYKNEFEYTILSSNKVRMRLSDGRIADCRLVLEDEELRLVYESELGPGGGYTFIKSEED
jgi:serine/threonine protein kinase